MTTHSQSSQQPSPRSEFRILGFPPPPKSVRTWKVPASGEIEAAKPGLSPVGNSISSPQTFGVNWLRSRGVKGVCVLVAAITLLAIVIKRLIIGIPF